MTIQQSLLSAVKKLISHRLSSAHLDAELLLSHLLRKPRGYLLAHPDKKISSQTVKKFNSLVAKRLRSVPVAYLTGHREFYSLDFLVNKNTLIPRPETELLVEQAIKTARDFQKQNRQQNTIRHKPFAICDIGTGSGCIAVTLAKYLPQAKIIATDISPRALAIAKKNARLHKVSQKIKFISGNLAKPFQRGENRALAQFDLVVANLPYLTADELANVPHEPKTALYGGKLGLELIEKLLSQTLSLLNEGGIILLEIAPTQAKALEYMVDKLLTGKKTEFIKDLSGRDRVVKIY